MNRLVILTLLFTPLVAWGQITNFDSILDAILNIIQQLTLIVASCSLLVFFWGLAKFILNAESSDAQSKGRDLMTWGVIALFVMTSVFGILAFIERSLGVDGQDVMPSRPSFDLSSIDI